MEGLLSLERVMVEIALGYLGEGRNDNLDLSDHGMGYPGEGLVIFVVETIQFARRI